MTTEMQQKRQQLKDISKAAKMLVGTGQAESVNDALAKIYQQQGHEEIRSFKNWLSKGYVVKRGEKALLMWGQPLKAANQEKQADNEKDEFSFFPLAYVFSNQQVEPLKR